MKHEISKDSAEIEQAIQEKGLEAPRLNPEYINSRIAKVIYSYPEGTLTLCTLVLVNGYKVTGEADCVSADNYDKEIGNKIAKGKAVEQIWPLEGYLLKQKLYEDKGEG